MIIADIAQVSPTFIYFPSVPRMPFEKIYTLHATSSIEDKEQLKQAVGLGVKVRMMKEAGEEVPADLQQRFDAAEEKLGRTSAGCSAKHPGVRHRRGSDHAGDPRLLLRLRRRRARVPVMKSYG